MTQFYSFPFLLDDTQLDTRSSYDRDRDRDRGHQSNRRDREYHDPRDGGNRKRWSAGDGGGDRNDNRGREVDYRRVRRDSRDGGSGGGRDRGAHSHSKLDDRRNAGRRRDDYYGRQGDEIDHKRRRMSEERDGRRRNNDNQDEYEYDNDGGDNNCSNSKRRRRPPPLKKKKAEWPSAFEDSGASYVFDARSGLFYEASSDFFYDPKNKLYYSNAKKIYYRHCPENEESVDGERVWKEVKPEDGAMGGIHGSISGGSGKESYEQKDAFSQDLVVQALQGSNNSSLNGNKQEKKKINICIKKKFSGSALLKRKFLERDATSSGQSALEEKKTLAQKTRQADIEKWAQRAGETKTDGSVIADDTTNANSTKRIKMTKLGKPICR